MWNLSYPGRRNQLKDPAMRNMKLWAMQEETPEKWEELARTVPNMRVEIIAAIVGATSSCFLDLTEQLLSFRLRFLIQQLFLFLFREIKRTEGYRWAVLHAVIIECGFKENKASEGVEGAEEISEVRTMDEQKSKRYQRYQIVRMGLGSSIKCSVGKTLGSLV